MALSISSPSAVLMLNIPGVYPAAVQIQGFAVDDAFMPEATDIAVVQVGVDGFAGAGIIPVEIPMLIRLMANSPSFPVFENWYGAQFALGDLIPCSAVMSLPSIGRKYTGNQGVLQRLQTMSEVRRVLMAREFRITWLPQGIHNPALTMAPI